MGDNEDNIFSQPWNDSDLVIVVEDNEFHVHRSILALQSPVFKTMLYGNFQDSKQDKIELKADKYEAMLPFLQLLYPANMLDENKANVNINEENIFQILEVADKYTAINVIKQCMKETERLKPENALRLLPIAARNKLPLEKILEVIARHISMDNLETFSSHIGDDSVYIKTLVTKCRLYENVAKLAHPMILCLLQSCVAEKSRDQSSIAISCVQHNRLDVKDFKEAKKCKICLHAFLKNYIDKYVVPPSTSDESAFLRETRQTQSQRSVEFLKLLALTDDIATSLQS